MMAEAAWAFVCLNVIAAAAIVVVLVLRRAMRAAFGARAAYAIWIGVPAAALASCLPRSLAAAPFSQLPLGSLHSAFAAAPDASLTVGIIVWALGMLGALGVLVGRQRRFVASLGHLAVESISPRVWRADAVGVGPAIVGAIVPKLVLPRDFESRFNQAERELVLAHESEHLKRLDPAINGIVALAQCVCWFNPLVHIASAFMRVDQELACDAVVAARFPSARRTYAGAILRSQMAPGNLPIGCLWPSTAPNPLRQRIVMLANKPLGRIRTMWGAAAALSISVFTGLVAWAAQPITDPIDETRAETLQFGFDSPIRIMIRHGDPIDRARVSIGRMDLGEYRPRTGDDPANDRH